MDNLLHDLGIFCFLVIFFILAAFLIGYGYQRFFRNIITAGDRRVTASGYIPFFVKPWMFVCTAGLPALGAAPPACGFTVTLRVLRGDRR